MEDVQGLLGRLKLSEAEKGGVKIGGSGGRHARSPELQAVGKVLTERLISSETVERTLGKIWCPIKGVLCKDLGENHFLVTFLQPTGKRRALEDGPWMIAKDLVVMLDFDESKTIDEMEFNQIPIWVRVANLPLGMMDADTGKIIGEKIGVYKEVDVDEDGRAAGRLLRIKVIIDIRKPLMRGITVKVGVDDEEKWCSFSYEFLPDFCYTCGLIGHTDRQCEIKLGKGDMQQFSRNLRFIPDKKRGEVQEAKWGSGSSSRSHWDSRGSGSRGFMDGRGKRWGSSGSGSDALTWRKSSDGSDKEKEEERTSPLKTPVEKDGGDSVDKVMSPRVVGKEEVPPKNGSGKRSLYRRINKTRKVQNSENIKEKMVRKRKVNDGTAEVDECSKKLRLSEVDMLSDDSDKLIAEPADQLCEDQ